MHASIAVWCMGWLIAGGSFLTIDAAQRQAEPINMEWKRIGVLPFFQGRDSKAGENATCPIDKLSLQSGIVEEGAEHTVTSFILKALERRYGEEKVIRCHEIRRASRQLPRDTAKDTLRSLAQRIGKAVNAEFMIAGTVWRYRDRVRDPIGPGKGASVAFGMYLIETSSGTMVWKSRFDETQLPLTEDISGAEMLIKKGIKWLSADELASYGVEEVFEEFPL